MPLPKAPTVKPSLHMLQMLNFPRREEATGEAEGEAKGFRVRLTLTASSINGEVIPGLAVGDCNRCLFCLDKPKNGGAGTKRQKCILKRTPMDGPMRVVATLSIASAEYLAQLDKYASQPPPQELIDAAAAGPLKLVWGLRRAPRARPLPPAYVLM